MSETIYDALHESHATQRSLCRRLLRSPPDAARRSLLFRELRIELAAHAAAEERFLYAPILMHDLGLQASRHALHEHHEIDELVEALQEREPLARGWLALARRLSHEVHHHLREEETRFFQVSGRILAETRKRALARDYRRDFMRMREVVAAG
jgi:hypothetical protein